MPDNVISRSIKWLPWADCIAREQLDRALRRLPGRARRRRPPVFIVGSGRCGTTLLGVILDSHPAISITPETQMLPAVVPQLLRTRGVTAMVDRLFTFPRIAETGVTRDAVLALYRKRCLHTPSGLLECFYTAYAQQRGKVRWGDNTPDYAGCMDLIEKLFGGASFIHMIRDGRDVAVSVMPLAWGPNNIADAALWWKTKILGARRMGQTLSHYHEMRYEDLLRKPEETLRSVCSFLGEPFDPSMLEYETAGKARLDQLKLDLGQLSAEARKQSQEKIASGFDASRIGRWKQVLSEAERREFYDIAGDLLRELGYGDSPHE